MRLAYLFEHWALTLLLAPFTSQVLQYGFLQSPHQIAALLEVYPVTLIFSVAFSFPTFLVYMVCFYFLSRYKVKSTISKFILIAVSVAGVYITMVVIKGSMSQEITIAYSLTTLIVGLIVRLGTSRKTVGDQTIVI